MFSVSLWVLLESVSASSSLVRYSKLISVSAKLHIFLLSNTYALFSPLLTKKATRSVLASSTPRNWLTSWKSSVSYWSRAQKTVLLTPRYDYFVNSNYRETQFQYEQDFYRPIITPYELEIALQSEPSWTGKYVLDFEKLLAEYSHGDDESKSEHMEDLENEESPMFSLVTGRYRHAKRYGFDTIPDAGVAKPSNPESSSALAPRNRDNALTLLSGSAAGDMLNL